MKRLIDVKSLVIGVLATALFFTIVGAKSRNDANFNTITAKGIKIVNPEGKPVAYLWSYKGGGGLDIFNKHGNQVVSVQSNKDSEGVIYVDNKEGKTVAILKATKEGEGIFAISNKEGTPVAFLASVKGEGGLGIYNKHGKKVADLGSNKEGGGMLGIYNKEGKDVAMLTSDKEGEGIFAISNKEGTPVAFLSSKKGGGMFSIYGGGSLNIFNKHGKRVATVQANKKSDGAIYLCDRYGDGGWAMTGKR